MVVPSGSLRVVGGVLWSLPGDQECPGRDRPHTWNVLGMYSKSARVAATGQCHAQYYDHDDDVVDVRSTSQLPEHFYGKESVPVTKGNAEHLPELSVSFWDS
ncbi:hypothetical protein QAD02_021442 [Eretmocerus hayati]|uniref:Uncharacterized protein n=1 Tax=Eretmocerus hayati TaxID=131215 RepID=A0ACC2PQR2_9HYME|nr:hypothetical protein QAD02_021442 [Eretmocerus hayati]